MTTVSIVIPIYNTEAYLHDCLESLRVQVIVDYKLEVILVNDGSTDRSESVVAQFLHSHPNEDWKLLSQENRGISAARNEGLRQATGDFIYFLDSDDYLACDTIRRCLKTALDARSDLVIGRTINFNLSGDLECHYADHLVDKARDNFSIAEYSEIVNVVSACAKLFRRELIKNITFPDKLIHEDNYFSLLTYDRAKSISINPSAVYNRRIREDPKNLSTTQRLGIESFRDYLKVYELLIPEISEQNKVFFIKLAGRNMLGYILDKLDEKYLHEAYKRSFGLFLRLWLRNLQHTVTFAKTFAQIFLTRMTGRY